MSYRSPLGALVALLAVGAAGEQAPYQVGRATWYGMGFHGQATASGEVFDTARFSTCSG